MDEVWARRIEEHGDDGGGDDGDDGDPREWPK